MDLLIDLLREVSLDRSYKTKQYQVLIDIAPLQNSEIVAFASLYCKLYEYSLFILRGGRWKYDTKIRDICLTMVSLWPSLWKLLCFTHTRARPE